MVFFAFIFGLIENVSFRLSKLFGSFPFWSRWMNEGSVNNNWVKIRIWWNNLIVQWKFWIKFVWYIDVIHLRVITFYQHFTDITSFRLAKFEPTWMQNQTWMWTLINVFERKFPSHLNVINWVDKRGTSEQKIRSICNYCYTSCAIEPQWAPESIQWSTKENKERNHE